MPAARAGPTVRSIPLQGEKCHEGDFIVDDLNTHTHGGPTHPPGPTHALNVKCQDQATVTVLESL